ncbi:MAG: glycoside hydrolase family 78 protein [Treponema sp.]|jgi:alpha-L-rhamnosidase|nr:glycoside hydrolase family 78 protein [Treponema sp.]
MTQAKSLKVNHLLNPLGISPGKAAFSWLPDGGIRQTAFHLVIQDHHGQTVTDTGKITSGETVYEAPHEFASRTRFIWSLTLWDENDEKGEPVQAWFETGIACNEWQAQWIDPETNRPQKGAENRADTRVRASYLRRVFHTEETERARLYITAHGIYNVYINGVHVDGWLFAPGPAQYDKRLAVQTYDAGALLKKNENTIDVVIGDGWYRGSTGNSRDINTFGDDIALLCQLEIDGKPVLVSDEHWKASQNGPLGLNDMFLGEEYDAQRTIDDWHGVAIADFGFDNLTGSDCMPIAPHERFPAVLIVTPRGEQVLDFGQNFSGYVELRLHAKAGQKLVMTYGETLDREGNFITEGAKNPPRKPVEYQKVEYICKDGLNEYHVTTCYFGFRYVKVETGIAIDGTEFTGVAVYTEMEQTGFFECGVPGVNQLFHNTLWSMKSNFTGVPTDCPTREKSGFTGDAQIFVHTAMYLMDCYPVLRQWLLDLSATQSDNGGLRQVAPDKRPPGYFENSSGWCDAIEIVPYRLMRRYNSLEPVRENYEAMRKWILFCLERGKETRPENDFIPGELKPYFVDHGFHWGEWLEPGRDTMEHMKNVFAHGEPEAATAYLAYGCVLLSSMAKQLGRHDDAAFFAEKAALAKQAYRYVFVKDGIIDSARQCRYVRPIALGLLSADEQQCAADTLAKNIAANGNKLNTGFLSTPELCRALTDNGHAQTAYDLLLQKECPGWLYPCVKGATTIWERWDGINEEGEVKDSFNHYAYGAVVGWLFDRVCGINVEDGHIRIQPYPNPALGYAGARYLSPLGEIRSGWKYSDGCITYTITIPCNQSAEIILPGGCRHNAGPGTWHYDEAGI